MRATIALLAVSAQALPSQRHHPLHHTRGIELHATTGALRNVSVFVWGGTPAGIAAAVVAAEDMAKSGTPHGGGVVLAVPEGDELGGMEAGGIGWDDVMGVDESNLSPVYGNSSV